MTDFNLLPQEYRKKSLVFRHVLILAVIAFSIWPIAKYGFLDFISINMIKKDQLTAMNKEIAGYPVLEEELAELQSSLDEYEQRILAFEEMEEGTPMQWQDVLQTLTGTLPSGSCLMHFTCDNNTILLSGTGKNDKTSADYLRNLKSSGCFSEVRMEKVVYQQGDEVNFTIRCTIINPQEGLSHEHD